MSLWKNFFGDYGGTETVAVTNNRDDIVLIKDAGWHFSSILDDDGILKKMTGAADYMPDAKLPSY